MLIAEIYRQCRYSDRSPTDVALGYAERLIWASLREKRDFGVVLNSRDVTRAFGTFLVVVSSGSNH